MIYFAGSFDVAVIGAGHAGIEAALASARLGASTVVFTISLDSVGNMPCNPSIGGTAKGHLVREIDSLGGEMGRAADATMLQSRMLNRGKGPAVHSLRVQSDRANYHLYMKHALESQERLVLKQAEITGIEVSENGEIESVTTALGARYKIKALVIATGTYLRGKIFVGEYQKESGPDGMHPSVELFSALDRLGVELRRFKTGTPARVLRRSIDFSKLEEQPGDEKPVPFSYSTKTPPENRVLCHIAYTNQDTHSVITKNLNRSPLFSGDILGVGPRYCPSIEDKVVRFKDKQRHQLFIEPMGLNTEEVYLQGMSSSLPEEVQVELYRTIPGFEHLEIMRNAYAIEYDSINPLELLPTLEFKKIKGIFGAGQFCGTSGYEEAAAQGLIAGINAAHRVFSREPFVLPRHSSYIGTLIDDIVTKGCMDPYRMMTSRSEYRLLLRQDNADSRMMPLGHALGLTSDEAYGGMLKKEAAINEELRRVAGRTLPPSDGLNAMLRGRDTAPITTGATFEALLRRPQVSYDDIAPFDPTAPPLPDEVIEGVEIALKYDGYIKRQLREVERQKDLEKNLLPPELDYTALKGLRLEAAEKLNKVRPRDIGQASRISGVSPADISVLIIWQAQNRRRAKADG